MYDDVNSKCKLCFCYYCCLLFFNNQFMTFDLEKQTKLNNKKKWYRGGWGFVIGEYFFNYFCNLNIHYHFILYFSFFFFLLVTSYLFIRMNSSLHKSFLNLIFFFFFFLNLNSKQLMMIYEIKLYKSVENRKIYVYCLSPKSSSNRWMIF